MNILILGLSHQIQPSALRGGGDEFERIEVQQKNSFTSLLKSLIENRRVQFIAEDAQSGGLSIAEIVAHDSSCRYTNIEMPPAERQRHNIPENYLSRQSEYSPEQRAQWNRKQEEYMVRMALAMKGDAKSALILCGREHTDSLAVLFRRAGNVVETSDLNKEPWYIENWLKPERRSNIERRKNPRYMFTTSAEIIEIHSGTLTKARTSDLSAGGCFVDSPSPFSVGTAVRIRLTKEKITFDARAQVTYSLAGSGMGLMFTDIQPAQLRKLERWLGELSGDLLPETEGLEQEEQAPVEEKLTEKGLYVLNELIIALMRKGVLNEEDGRNMLRKLLE